MLQPARTMINILLIDHALDEVISVRRLLPALQATQFTIDSVIDYRAIFEALNRDDFDVCLIDSAFGNGIKLAGHIRSVGRMMPIILITSNNAAEVLAAIRNGIADCLIRDQLTSAGVERSICSVWTRTAPSLYRPDVRADIWLFSIIRTQSSLLVICMVSSLR
jgi:CheY-like chemotaxis protein